MGQPDTPLPECYPAVAADIVRLCCLPPDGLWMDLGAGAGPLAFALAHHDRGRILLVDPDTRALAKARERATADGIAHRVVPLAGRAEALPLSDCCVDLVVSRGSIYFWDSQSKGLAETYRVLREGGQAIIGGGLGSDYPQWARQEFIRRRHAGERRKGPQAYERFLWLRSPEAFAEWAREAELPHHQVIGEGGRPPEDPAAGLGIWLHFRK